MSIEAELDDFFSEEITSVVEDSDKFRRKLNIGSDAFKYLSNAENLGSFITAITSGAGVAFFSYFGWMASLGIVGKIGLIIGVVSTPSGWIAAAGAGCAATILITRRVFQSVKKEAVTEIPNFINSPLDILGSSICNFMCPILLKIAYADGHVTNHEHKKIRAYFIDQWGINSNYVDALLKCGEANLPDLEWDGLSTTLKEIEKSGDLKYSTMTSEIIATATEVMLCDGESHPQELIEIDCLRKELNKDTFYTSMKNRLKR